MWGQMSRSRCPPPLTFAWCCRQVIMRLTHLAIVPAVGSLIGRMEESSPTVLTEPHDCDRSHAHLMPADVSQSTAAWVDVAVRLWPRASRARRANPRRLVGLGGRMRSHIAALNWPAKRGRCDLRLRQKSSTRPRDPSAVGRLETGRPTQLLVFDDKSIDAISFRPRTIGMPCRPFGLPGGKDMYGRNRPHNIWKAANGGGRPQVRTHGRSAPRIIRAPRWKDPPAQGIGKIIWRHDLQARQPRQAQPESVPKGLNWDG